MAVEETASALEFLRDTRFCTSSTGGVGSEAEMSVDCFDLRKRGIAKVDDQMKPMVGSVTEALIHQESSHGDFMRFGISGLRCDSMHGK